MRPRGNIMTKLSERRYVVKCDDCKTVIRRTDSLAASAAGGYCPVCLEELAAKYDRFAVPVREP